MFQDSRLEGGYESVPTRDIHMKQIGFEREWLTLLQDYVSPLQAKVFLGYESQVRPLETETAHVGAGAGGGGGSSELHTSVTAHGWWRPADFRTDSPAPAVCRLPDMCMLDDTA